MTTKSVRKPPFGAKAILSWINEESALIAADMVRLADIISKKEVKK